MQTPLTRAQVPLEQTWNLTDLFASPEAWSAEMDALGAAAQAFASHQGRLGSSPAALLAALDAREAMMTRLQRAMAYAYLQYASDGTDPAHQAAQSRATAVGSQVEAAAAFMEPEILALPEGAIGQFLDDLPALQAHRVELQDLIALKPHTLSAETEQTLAALGQVLVAPQLVYMRAKAGDMQFASFTDGQGVEHPNSFNLFESRHESDPDTMLRRAAWASFCKGLVPYQNTFATTLATEIAKNVVLARARGYASAEHYLLHRQKVSHQLYTSVLDTVQQGVAEPMRRYARLRRRVLGLDRMLYCDLKVPMDADYVPAVSFEESRAMILEAVTPMGADYQAIIAAAFDGRWIDRATNVGKSTGAFCASPYRVHPYILLTWAGTMRDVFVLAHELGHGAHFVMAGRHQSFMNTRPGLPFVEAPSIMNEVLLARHILARHQDARMRRWVLMQVLGTYHHNFVTHLLEAELQRQLYAAAEAGTAITATLLNARKRAILEAFWGDAIEVDDGAAMTWMRQPHYYLGLYPYTYSVGLVVATALAERARTEGDAVFAGWLGVLKMGGTASPLALSRAAGVDLTRQQPFEAAVAYVSAMVEELERSF